MNRLKKTGQSILEALQKDLEGEYEAIALYQQHIDSTDVKEIKDLLTHIMNEEKEHAKELLELIAKYK